MKHADATRPHRSLYLQCQQSETYEKKNTKIGSSFGVTVDKAFCFVFFVFAVHLRVDAVVEKPCSLLQSRKHPRFREARRQRAPASQQPLQTCFGGPRQSSSLSLRAAGRSFYAATHGGTHGFGWDQVQVLVVGNLVQPVAVLQQLPTQVRMDLTGTQRNRFDKDASCQNRTKEA